MGLYFRKSISVGPLRFNLSKGGIGVSAGIPGFRIGTGPRGNYVHMGAGGIYYRTTLLAARRPHNAAAVPQAVRDPIPPPVTGSPSVPADSTGPMVEIESAHVSQLVDSSSADLLDELRRKKSRTKFANLVAIVGGVATLISFTNTSGIWPLIVVSAFLGCWLYAHLRDVLARATVLFYEFDNTLSRAYEGLLSAGKHLAAAKGFWHVQGQAKVNDSRYHAGASGLSSLGRSVVSFHAPKFLKTNVEVFSIPVGKQVLHFFPDRLLIEEPAGIGAVNYHELTAEIVPTSFVEERSVPADAEVVGHTWRYVNRNGSPDRRFKDNRQIPICRYAELHLRSSSGLNECVMVSQPAAAQYFCEHLTYLRARLPSEGLGRAAERLPA